ncbi:MAG: exosortase C-terminal domain/associated protein EpsI, partial [Legionellales bacterium]
SYTAYLLATLALVLLCGPIARTITRIDPTPLLQSFDHFPLALGPWSGSTSPIASDVLNILQTDIYLNADYTDHNRDLVTLWIAYYQKHGSGNDFYHNPKICMVGSGWEIIEEGTTTVSNALPVNYLILKRGEQKLLAYYWYLQQGHWVAKNYFFKFFMAYNVLVNHRTDWALVRLVTPFKQDLDLAKERLNSFSQLLIPILPEYIKK